MDTPRTLPFIQTSIQTENATNVSEIARLCLLDCGSNKCLINQNFVEKNIPKARLQLSSTTLELVCPTTRVDVSYETRLHLRFRSADRILDSSYNFLIVPGLFVDVLLGSPFFADKAFHSMSKLRVYLNGRGPHVAKNLRRGAKPSRSLMEIPIVHMDMRSNVISMARHGNEEIVGTVRGTHENCVIN